MLSYKERCTISSYFNLYSAFYRLLERPCFMTKRYKHFHTEKLYDCNVVKNILARMKRNGSSFFAC